MKKNSLLIVVLILVLSLISCKEDVPIDDPNEENVGLSDYTIDDFYNEIVVYESKIDELIAENEEVSNIEDDTILLGVSDIVTITRDEILEVYNNSEFKHIYGSYAEPMRETKYVVSKIKVALEEDNDIRLGEEVENTSNDIEQLKVLKSTDGHILIDAKIFGVQTILKLNLDDGLLDYQEFRFYYNLASIKPNEDATMQFSYFKFLEDTEVVDVRYSQENSLLHYVNLVENNEFLINGGSGVIEGSKYDETGYFASYYNNELNAQAYVSIANNEIIGETYDIFTEQGQILRYDDYDFFDGVKRLQVNFITATGWDYVKVADGSNPEVDAITGIYLNNGTKIYDEWFNHTFTPAHGHLGLWINLTDEEEVTDEMLSLNQYGMNLDDSRATVAYLNSVKAQDFNEIKSYIDLDGLDFFASDQHQSLYDYVDQDIRNTVEGITDIEEPIETTGDVDAFDDATESFDTVFSESPYFIGQGTNTINFYKGDNLLSTDTTYTYEKFDLNALFYQYIETYQGVNSGYYLDGSNNSLVEYLSVSSYSYQYNILTDRANQATFLSAYLDYVGSDESVPSHINKVNDYTFELTYTPRSLSSNGVSLAVLFNQMGLSGFDDKDITITYTFDQDFGGYQISYNIDALTYTEVGISYTVSFVYDYQVSIERPTYTRPLDNDQIKIVLPNSINSEFLFYADEYTLATVIDGVSYIPVVLEAGEYELTTNGNHNTLLSSVLVNGNGIELPFDGMRYTIESADTYYIKITSQVLQSIQIHIWNSPSPNLYNYELNAVTGSLSLDVNISTSENYISVPGASVDRVLIFEASFEESTDGFVMFALNLDDYNYIYDMSTNAGSTAYMYLPKNEEIDIEFMGNFEGIININYDYMVIPSGTFDSDYSWDNLDETLFIFVTEETPSATLYFTITETGTYELSTIKYEFGYAYIDAELYSSEGVKIDYDWDSPRELEAGDYYISYTLGYNSKILMLLEVSMIQID